MSKHLTLLLRLLSFGMGMVAAALLTRPFGTAGVFLIGALCWTVGAGMIYRIRRDFL
jgi:hypothetical protein